MQEKNKNNTEISERISKVIEHLGVTASVFGKNLKYERSQTIYDILNSKSAPSFDFFNKFYTSEYSEIIDPIWLITGKGEMILKNIDQIDDRLQEIQTLNEDDQKSLYKIIDLFIRDSKNRSTDK